jgi:putative restriction endonuclease
VQHGDPYVVQNGLALSAAMHWLFDRHLISLSDGFGLPLSHNRVPGKLGTLFERQRDRIHLPLDKLLSPHLDYVRRHRQAFTA